MRIYNKILTFSWFCNDFAQNIDKLPSFYPFFKKNCKQSRPDGLNIRCGKACRKANIYKVINFICTYVSDGLIYLYEFLYSLFNLIY